MVYLQQAAEKPQRSVTPAPAFAGVNLSPRRRGGGVQTPFLRRQETITKELGSCLHRKPWIPAGVYPDENRGRNDNEMRTGNKVDLKLPFFGEPLAFQARESSVMGLPTIYFFHERRRKQNGFRSLICYDRGLG
jgi:hypothetical protein